MALDRTEQFLNFCCELGRQMIQNGAEIYRVEDSAAHLLKAYGYREAEVFAIPSCIILSIQGEDRSHTKSVRVRSSANNLDKLDRLNALCRQVCLETPEMEEAMARLREIMGSPAYPAWLLCLAHSCGAAFFTLFWGGGALDAAAALPCGILVWFTVTRMRRASANTFFTNVCASALLAVLPVLLDWLGAPVQMDQVIIGATMLLVPGIAITNAMRDVLSGDFLTALTRIGEVLIVSVAIAIGIAIPVGLARMLPGGI